MNKKLDKHKEVWRFLQGVWTGSGYGTFPTIDPFSYRETLTFRHYNAATLIYEQHTEKRVVGQLTYKRSHTERGFLRFQSSGKLVWVNVQGNGRWEIMSGHIEIDGRLVRLTFSGQDILNDERVRASSRIFEIRQTMLQYQMSMQTKNVAKLTPHLTATLYRKNHSSFPKFHIQPDAEDSNQKELSNVFSSN